MPNESCQNRFTTKKQYAEVIASPPALERLSNLRSRGINVLIPNFTLVRSRLPDRTLYLLHYSRETSCVSLQAGTLHTFPSQEALTELCETFPHNSKDGLRLVIVKTIDSTLRGFHGVVIDSGRMLRVSRITNAVTAACFPLPEEDGAQLRNLKPEGALQHQVMRPTQQFIQRLASRRIAVVGQHPAVQQTARELLGVGVRHLTLIGCKIQAPDRNEQDHHYETIPKRDPTENRIGNSPQRSNRITSDTHAKLLRPRSREEMERSVSIATDIFSYTNLPALKKVDIVFCITNSVPVRLAIAALCSAYMKPLVQISTSPRTGSVFPSATGHASDSQKLAVDIRMAMPGSACINCLEGLPDIDLNWFDQYRDHGCVTHAHGGSESDLNWPVSLGIDLVQEIISFTFGILQSFDGTSCQFRSSVDGAWVELREKRLQNFKGKCPICKMMGIGDFAPGRFFRMVHDLSYWQFMRTNENEEQESIR